MDGTIYSYLLLRLMEMLLIVMVLASMMLVRLPNEDAERKTELIPTNFESNFKVGVANAINEDIERVQKQLQELVDLCAAETWRRNAIKYGEHNKIFLETHSKLIELMGRAYELYHEIYTSISDEGRWSGNVLEDGQIWVKSYVKWVNERNALGVVSFYQDTIVVLEDLQSKPVWSDKADDYIRHDWHLSELMEHIFDNIALTARCSRDYLGSCYTDFSNAGNWIDEKTHTIITHPLLISDKSKIQPYDLPHVGSCTSCGDYDGVPSPTLKETYFEPSWQEYPGTIVNPSYHTLTCVRCGTDRDGDGAGHFIDGVDFKGQSMYAGMTTHEVAMMCTCHDDPHDCYPCNSEYY